METNKLNKTINEIFEDSYVIPLYQRNFAWGEEQIQQLIQDIYDASQQGDLKYYIGTLVVLKRHNGVYEVIDGQQRLTVLSLLIRILGLKTDLKLSYDSRPEVENFLREFYKDLDYKSCEAQTYNFSNAVKCIKNSKVLKSDGESVEFDDIRKDLVDYLLNKVILFRVEIPEDTDVASYFEIMNNRGEQLQKHEIFKAKLMAKLVPNFHNEFNLIWTACSNMKNHIQACFGIEQRRKYFGENYDSFCFNGFAIEENENNKVKTNTKRYSIADILSGNSTCSIEKYGEKETTDKYNSIIDFPNFLMHVLKLYMQKENLEEEISLDEKFLLKTNIEKIDPSKFIYLLFKCRVLFDRYIIKTIDLDSQDDFRWTLRKLKRTNYNDNISYYEFDTFGQDKDQDMIIKAQSMLQVTFRQRIYKNWLYDTLKFLYDLLYEKESIDIKSCELLTHLNGWMKNYYGSLKKNKFLCLGTKTPHFVLNFIDYLYWRKAKSNQNQINQIKINDFSFKYWNSVEHHLSVNKATIKNNGVLPNWVDQIGNLFLISKNMNSRLSDRDVQEKVESFKGPNMGPSRQIIYHKPENNNYNWGKEEIKKHTKAVFYLLKDIDNILFNS